MLHRSLKIKSIYLIQETIKRLVNIRSKGALKILSDINGSVHQF